VLPVQTKLVTSNLRAHGEVEDFDSDGAGYIAIFAGQSADVRARDYDDAPERGASTSTAQWSFTSGQSRSTPALLRPSHCAGY
jgi:hypothetical protein